MANNSAGTDVLLDRLCGGDQDALGELFSRYRDQLWRMVDLRLDHRLYGRVSPSDILQETYIEALKRVDHYQRDPQKPFVLWLRFMTYQCMIDVHRRHLGAQMRDAELELSIGGTAMAASSICLAAQLIGPLTSPSGAAMRKEILAQVEKALDGLDPIDREVLALRHFEELGNNEVAEILGLQKHAASKRYVRALARLKDALAEVPGFFDDAE